MTKATVRINKRNNGNRVWRYEWWSWDESGDQLEHSYAITLLGARWAARKATRKELARKKRATNPQIAKEYTIDV